MKGLANKMLPNFFKIRVKLLLNFYRDFLLYRKYSTIFGLDGFYNKEAILILQYHGVEKGLLFNPIRPKFAKDRVLKMHALLSDIEISSKVNLSQVFIGYKIIIEYYDLHQRMGIDISDYYSQDLYLKYKKIVGSVKNLNFASGKVDYNREDFYKNTQSFEEFAHSRKSIRSYTGAKIDIETIKKAVKLANTAPSVCNRQASKVYLIENKKLIDSCLHIQGGFNGYIENVQQLLIVTTDRQYFYTVGERNQFYIDGGIYLVNLLYALHFYKIAACPANWGKDISAEKALSKVVEIPEAEKIICMVPIGVAPDKFSVTLSYRRDVDEVFKVIN